MSAEPDTNLHADPTHLRIAARAWDRLGNDAYAVGERGEADRCWRKANSLRLRANAIEDSRVGAVAFGDDEFRNVRCRD